MADGPRRPRLRPGPRSGLPGPGPNIVVARASSLGLIWSTDAHPTNSAAVRHCPRTEKSGVRLQRIGRAAQVELKVVTIDAGAATPQRAHAHTNLLLVLSGTGAVVTGDDRQLIGPDDVVATAPDASHEIAAGPTPPCGSCASTALIRSGIAPSRSDGCRAVRVESGDRGSTSHVTGGLQSPRLKRDGRVT